MKRIAMLACVCLFAIGVPIAGAAGGNDHRSTDKNRCENRGNGVCGLDKEFLMESIQGDLFEIQGGKIALSKSHNPAVVRLANRLITDHSKSLADSQALARRLGVKVPTEPSPSQQWELMVVQRMNGGEFNYWYSLLEVKDHQQDISLAESEVKDGCNQDVRKNARDELPVLRLHLHLAQEAVAASRGSGSGSGI
jgi:putative membrane protein